MLKALLKKVIPRAVLSAANQQVNRLRIATVDKLLFPERHVRQEEFTIRRDTYPFAGVPMATEALEVRLQRQIAIWQGWTQDEYLLVYEQPCLIEPRAGWALTANNQLLYPSLGFSRVDYLRKPALAARRMHRQPVAEYDELISLRDTGEANYYHFYNDILTKLFFLEEKLGIGPEVPILIAATLYNRAYFKYFLQHPYLRDRTWIVQDQQYVRSRKTYFCKPLTHTFSYYERIRALAQPLDLVRTGQERRIFVTRSPKRVRYIENREEIEQLCREAGLEVVDFDELTIAEQISTMANARCVVGIHGAGLVNMLYRGGRPMSLLEIFPPGEYYPFHYMLMAGQLGFAYNGLIGQAGSQPSSAGFFVPPLELQARLQAMLAAEAI